jgi:integrase
MFLAGLGLPAIRFHDLRATWATLLLSKGVEAIKVMKMGGWKNIETMMIYSRKAGIDIRGSMDCLNLHDHNVVSARVLRMPS